MDPDFELTPEQEDEITGAADASEVAAPMWEHPEAPPVHEDALLQRERNIAAQLGLTIEQRVARLEQFAETTAKYFDRRGAK